ncbi:MAG TPA: MOSC N-terminal beta barrel domain-containing protein [Allosphingosinicella sp.]|nr:MOSC N-terminal beta barrel domain-containing protein [Allosphingosinicella sp.]
MPRIAAIYRYPIKGFSPDPLTRVELTPDAVLPFDRAYALEKSGRDFDPDAPRLFPKVKFLQLMSDERLARLDTRFDSESQSLTVFRAGRQVLKADLSAASGRRLFEQFLSAFLGGSPHVVAAPGWSFADSGERNISLINLNSVRDIGRIAGRAVDPLRFRGNVYVEDLPAWEEFTWAGKALAVGGETVFEVVEPIGRCAATNVDPRTGARDMQIPRLLEANFGHHDCGLYVRAVAPSELAVGSTIAPVN